MASGTAGGFSDPSISMMVVNTNGLRATPEPSLRVILSMQIALLELSISMMVANLDGFWSPCRGLLDGSGTQWSRCLQPHTGRFQDGFVISAAPLSPISGHMHEPVSTPRSKTADEISAGPHHFSDREVED